MEQEKLNIIQEKLKKYIFIDSLKKFDYEYQLIINTSGKVSKLSEFNLTPNSFETLKGGLNRIKISKNYEYNIDNIINNLNNLNLCTNVLKIIYPIIYININEIFNLSDNEIEIIDYQLLSQPETKLIPETNEMNLFNLMDVSEIKIKIKKTSSVIKIKETDKSIINQILNIISN